MKKYVFGVDIGGTTVKFGLFETNGILIDKWEIETRLEEEGKHILLDISKSIEDKLLEKEISKDELVGIGLGVPGPVAEDGTVLKCVNLGWGVFNVEEELSKLTSLNVKAGNDANIAALGEMWQGGAKGNKNVVMVTLGTGVGGGIIINGKVISGSDGAAGEIGHIKVQDYDHEACGCGNRGCLEQYASANGVVRMAKNVIGDNGYSKIPTVLTNKEDITCKDIFDAAKDGDKISLVIITKVGELLGEALANIACIVNPEVIVIGGGVSKAGEILVTNIERNYRKRAFHACIDTKFELASLGNDAGIYGGAQIML